MNVALENEIMGLIQGYFAPLVGKGTSKGMLGKIYSANVLNNTTLLNGIQIDVFRQLAERTRGRIIITGCYFETGFNEPTKTPSNLDNVDYRISINFSFVIAYNELIPGGGASKNSVKKVIPFSVPFDILEGDPTTLEDVVLYHVSQ
nr:MAG TPA: hypothetical protein [Caudoviricetes sp.]